MMSIKVMMMRKRLKNGPNKFIKHFIIYYVNKAIIIDAFIKGGNDFNEIIYSNQLRRFKLEDPKRNQQTSLPFSIWKHYQIHYIDGIAIKPLCLHVIYLINNRNLIIFPMFLLQSYSTAFSIKQFKFKDISLCFYSTQIKKKNQIY